MAAPGTGRLRAWLIPVIGVDRAAELAAAADAGPPPTAGWLQHDSDDD
jgi:hypothetical protein